MKILHLIYREDGGHGRAALRLHQALLGNGVASTAVVGRGITQAQASVHAMEHPAQRWWMQWMPTVHRRLLMLRYGAAAKQLRPASLPGLLGSTLRRHQPDIIHIHGVFDGLVSARQVASLGRPIVWTLHDMLTFSPGYHYRGDLISDAQEYGPLIDPQWQPNLQRLGHDILRAKARLMGNLPGVVSAPSQWLAEEARRSEVFQHWPVSTIPYAFDADAWPAVQPEVAKAALGLAPDKLYVLFGAESAGGPRKGADLLREALQRLPDLLSPTLASRVVLLVFGHGNSTTWQTGGIQVHSLGPIHDTATLARAYSAATVFVCPSREDNLPNTVIEALASGTPSISFRLGGLPDLIQHGQNGYLVPPFDTQLLAESISQALQGEGLLSRAEISHRVRTLTDPMARASDYRDVYQGLYTAK